MVWVQQKHAGALAVVAAWLGALLPWNVTYSSGGGPWVLFVRFPLFEFQYTSGFGAGVDGAALRTVIGAIQLQGGEGLELATRIWGLGALAICAALVLSVGYYTDEKRLEAGRIHPVRLMGGLLGLAAGLFGLATYFVWTGGFGGVPIPVGIAVLGLLAWVLLRAELTGSTESTESDKSTEATESTESTESDKSTESTESTESTDSAEPVE